RYGTAGPGSRSCPDVDAPATAAKRRTRASIPELRPGSIKCLLNRCKGKRLPHSPRPCNRRFGRAHRAEHLLSTLTQAPALGDRGAGIDRPVAADMPLAAADKPAVVGGAIQDRIELFLQVEQLDLRRGGQAVCEPVLVDEPAHVAEQRANTRPLLGLDLGEAAAAGELPFHPRLVGLQRFPLRQLDLG